MADFRNVAAISRSERVDTVISSEDDLGIEDFGSSRRDGTRSDLRDMKRMGKQQELKRGFGFLSILGFSCILTSTWEIQLTANTFGLINGGLAGLIWMYIVTWIGFFAIIASMAEMSSMAPTSGGQYHFAPKSCQKFLSYTTGWVCVLGWQTGIISIAFLTASQIQSLLVINNANYGFERWHGTLLTMAISSFAIIFNTYLAKKLPLVEGIILILHICGFFAILDPLWVLAPRHTSKDVFTKFADGGNWGSQVVSCIVGMLSPVFAFLGPDSAAHMSEETKYAARVVPSAMVWTVAINGVLGFIMLVTFCFCSGNVEEILANPDVMPFVQVFFVATESKTGTSLMTTIIIVLTTCGCITNVATASRQMFAFARDGGLPCSRFLAEVSGINHLLSDKEVGVDRAVQVRPGWDIPLNSVLVSFTITTLLSLVNIASTAAFNAVAGLITAALTSSYIVSIACVRLKRFRGEPLPYACWSLGKWGAPINDASIAYLVLIFVISFFPVEKRVDVATMNWNVVIYGLTVGFSGVFFWFKGRFVYHGPVTLVRKDI
ncbi:amino acid permease-domain-containing protein [Leptodontidium sp. MPI-SDFR-AT-0119]|nr:amino acid permease-domain-containing protein [Leptodontidium sp. MPI-SDFR-AT-0119]